MFRSRKERIARLQTLKLIQDGPTRFRWRRGLQDFDGTGGILVSLGEFPNPYPLTMPTTTTLTAICHQAWWLLGAMSDRRCAGNAVSCGTVVARCREQWRTAWHLLAQMERQVQGNEVPRGGLKPQWCFCGDRCLKKLRMRLFWSPASPL